MMHKCIVVGAGAHFAEKPLPEVGDLVIAADGGFEYLQRMRMRVDMLIGDFDSIRCRPQGVAITELPREKDDTDMLAAIKHGLGKGYRLFHIYGGTGGRFDHTVANMQCLAYLAEQDAQGYLYGENDITTCIRNGGMEFDSSHEGMISVFAHSDVARGVCLEGLKYELHEAELYNTVPLGVSNEFTGAAVRISVKDGTLIIVLQNDNAG